MRHSLSDKTLISPFQSRDTIPLNYDLTVHKQEVCWQRQNKFIHTWKDVSSGGFIVVFFIIKYPCSNSYKGCPHHSLL
jgi:hypothetical protein